MAKKLRFGYTLSRLLSTGFWRPLICWGVFCLVVIGVLCCVAAYLPDVSWVQLVGSFLDPGVFGGIEIGTSITNDGTKFWEQILLFVVSMLSIVLVASLLIGIISSTFNNIVSAYNNGDLRKSLKNHIIIIGTGEAVKGVLQQSLSKSKKVVVFAPSRPNMDGDFYFYRGSKTSKDDLLSIGIESAEKIYILSDKNIPNDDIHCLTCLDILKELSRSGNHKIHCYVVVNEFTTSEIFCYSKNRKLVESSNLFLVDIINTHEYIAEQLMVHSDFLPVIRKKDREHLNLVILGAGNIARGVAYTAAHICHYPDLDGKIRKSRITIMDSEAERFMHEFIAARPGLFTLSSYSFVNAKGERQNYAPKRDYQDIEWEFVALSPLSVLGQQYLAGIEANGSLSAHYVVCPENELSMPQYVQHLPRACYRHPLAVYANGSEAMLNRADSTGMYGRLIPFGFDCAIFNGQLLTERAERGKRVNFIYDQYSMPKANTPDEAWYKIPESDKLSSIYCALAFGLRDKCFEIGDNKAIYEAEHRRWMSTVLLLGYSYAPKTDKTHFLHQDLLPHAELPENEREKDKILLDAAEYILRG